MPYYSQKILDHFMRPKHAGSIKNPDGVGDTQNLKCGDVMKMYISIEESRGKKRLKEVKFETLGCGHAVAISDMLAELAQGKTLEQAKKISLNDIKSELGDIPPQKVHCVHLAETALRSAIADYEKK